MSGYAIKQPVTAEELTTMLDRLLRETRPPWYERAPYSWILGGAGTLTMAGAIHLLGWG